MSVIDQTVNQVYDTVTGREEARVVEHFGHPLTWYMEQDPVGWARTLAFVVKFRAGEADIDAYNAVLDMTNAELVEFFPQDAAATEEEAGKGPRPVSPLKLSPTTSQSGASSPAEAAMST